MSVEEHLVGSPGRHPRAAKAPAHCRVQAWVLVVAFLFTLNGVGLASWNPDLEVSAGLQLILRALAIVVFWRFLEAECAPYRVSFPLDMGYFLYATSFLLLPYYFWRTQRWRGMAKLLAVAGIWAGSYAFWQGVAWLVGLE
jgi:hypothetical protein